MFFKKVIKDAKAPKEESNFDCAIRMLNTEGHLGAALMKMSYLSKEENKKIMDHFGDKFITVAKPEDIAKFIRDIPTAKEDILNIFPEDFAKEIEKFIEYDFTDI